MLLRLKFDLGKGMKLEKEGSDVANASEASTWFWQPSGRDWRNAPIITDSTSVVNHKSEQQQIAQPSYLQEMAELKKSITADEKTAMKISRNIPKA